MKEFEVFQRVRQFMIEHQMLYRGSGIVIGLSGGADSMALTDILARLREEWDLELLAVHVNHGIRGEEARRDEETAEAFCRGLHIRYLVYHYDVPMVSKEWHLGEEETGRLIRREAFHKALLSLKAEKKYIALAHNCNDLAETVLHHLARGTSLRGMTGIAPTAQEIIRPVLGLKRQEIETYCRERNLNYVIDSSNLQDHYTRNRIRHHVLPVMEQEINSEAVLHIAEASVQIQEVYQYLCEQVERVVSGQKALENGYLLTEDFFSQPKVIQSHAVLRIFERLAGKRKDFSSVHVNEVLALYKKQVSKKMMLPYQLEAERNYEGVCIRKKKTNQSESREMKWNWDFQDIKQLRCPLGNFEVEIFSYFGEKIEEKKYTKWFDYDTIKGNLVVRTRQAGDYLVLHSEKQRKKLNRYFIDEKISSELRDQIPLLVCGEEVIWVVGHRIGETFKITKDTRRVLRITYQRGGYYEGENQGSFK